MAHGNPVSRMQSARTAASVLAEVARVQNKAKAEVVRRVKGRVSIDLCRAASRALRRRQAQAGARNEVTSSVLERTLLMSELEQPPAVVAVRVRSRRRIIQSSVVSRP